MATYRNVAFNLTITAKSAVHAQKKAERIVKKTGIKKVHAYQIIQLQRAVPTFMVDIIIKESVQLIGSKKSQRHASSVGEVITSKKNCPHPKCNGAGVGQH